MLTPHKPKTSNSLYLAAPDDDDRRSPPRNQRVPFQTQTESAFLSSAVFAEQVLSSMEDKTNASPNQNQADENPSFFGQSRFELPPSEHPSMYNGSSGHYCEYHNSPDGTQSGIGYEFSGTDYPNDTYDDEYSHDNDQHDDNQASESDHADDVDETEVDPG